MVDCLERWDAENFLEVIACLENEGNIDDLRRGWDSEFLLTRSESEDFHFPRHFVFGTSSDSDSEGSSDNWK